MGLDRRTQFGQTDGQADQDGRQQELDVHQEARAMVKWLVN